MDLHGKVLADGTRPWRQPVARPGGAPKTARPARIGGARTRPPGSPPVRWPCEPLPGARRLRTIFISDTHLGTRGCKADFLLDFLRHHECETLYLVGDIVDGWRLKRAFYWHRLHDAVIAEILRKAHAGTRVIYVPGNHDEVLRDYVGLNLGGVELVFEAVHVTAAGKRLLVIHGDHFDGVVRYAKWIAYLGDWAYTAALLANDGLNALRRRLGRPYWSLSAYLKRKVKNAVEYIANYERAVLREAAARGLDGVVCGHIHEANLRTENGLIYANDGDWVETCSALVEDECGDLSIVRWTEVRADLRAEARDQALA